MQLGALGWVGMGLGLAVVAVVAWWYRTSERASPVVAAVLWGVTAVVAFGLVALDVGIIRSRNPWMVPVLVGFVVLVNLLVYLRFRSMRR